MTQTNLDNQQIQERISILKKEIKDRELELKDLSKFLIKNETDVLTQFNIWANNGLDKETDSCIPSHGSALRNWCYENLDLGSMRGSVDFLGYDSFGLIAENEYFYNDQYKKEIDALRNDKIFIEACKQMMKENIDSFEIDW